MLIDSAEGNFNDEDMTEAMNIFLVTLKGFLIAKALDGG